MTKSSLKSIVNYYVQVGILDSIESPTWHIIHAKPGHPAANFIENSLQAFLWASIDDSVKECAEELVWDFVNSERTKQRELKKL